MTTGTAGKQQVCSLAGWLLTAVPTPKVHPHSKAVRHAEPGEAAVYQPLERFGQRSLAYMSSDPSMKHFVRRRFIGFRLR
jgi:hypothetical protein